MWKRNFATRDMDLIGLSYQVRRPVSARVQNPKW